jgi:antitoxin component of MazEF toxin-antitoxin module
LEIKEERDGFFVQALPDKLTLSDLLEEVRPGNLHGESFVDDPQGKEIW